MNTANLERRNLLKLLTISAGSAIISPIITSAANLPAEEVPKPVYIAPGEGEKYKIPSGEVIFKLNKAQTVGNLGSNEGLLAPGFLGAPPHFHKTFDEICIVQEGTLHVMVGEEVYEVAAGGWHLRPRSMVHTFWNSGNSPAKYIELFTPGGFEEYLKGLYKIVSTTTPIDTKAIGELVKKHDIILRFDLLNGIMDKYKVHL